MRADMETGAAVIAPVKRPLGIAEKFVGEFQQAQAGKDLAGVQKIDGNG
jgi:hypothetical protein